MVEERLLVEEQKTWVAVHREVLGKEDERLLEQKKLVRPRVKEK